MGKVKLKARKKPIPLTKKEVREILRKQKAIRKSILNGKMPTIIFG